MKMYLIEESGQYTIRMSVQSETKEEALKKFESILDDETPLYLNLESMDTEVEEFNW